MDYINTSLSRQNRGYTTLKRRTVIQSHINMKIVSLSLVVLLAAVVSGQLCVPETLNCHEVIPTIFKLGDGSCACGSKAHDGALKYDKGELYLCLNGKWKAFELKETHKFGTELNPGASCKDILDRADGKHLSDGVYWIRLAGNLKNTILTSGDISLLVPAQIVELYISD